jgi:hypothetical protein
MASLGMVAGMLSKDDDPGAGAVPSQEPALGRDRFRCPHAGCGVVAMQRWAPLNAYDQATQGQRNMADFTAAFCDMCHQWSLWLEDQMVYPLTVRGVAPNLDMPGHVQATYEEARRVAPVSGKSAAGLLRLSLQMLVDDLEPGKGSIDRKIGQLVERGLDPKVQKAMDVLRIVGNESVHPGTIDLDSDEPLLVSLFGLVNLIVEQMITRPRNLDELFSSMPPQKLAAIEARDSQSDEP